MVYKFDFKLWWYMFVTWVKNKLRIFVCYSIQILKPLNYLYCLRICSYIFVWTKRIWNNGITVKQPCINNLKLSTPLYPHIYSSGFYKIFNLLHLLYPPNINFMKYYSYSNMIFFYNLWYLKSFVFFFILCTKYEDICRYLYVYSLRF